MLTRLLWLSVIWLAISASATFVAGARLRRGGPALSLLWLVAVVGIGAAAALATFARPGEVALFSLAALLSGAWFIWRLPDWNAAGQVTWAASVLAAAVYLIYSLAVTLLTPLHALGFVLSWAIVCAEGLALALSLTYAFETLDVCTRWRWRRRCAPAAAPAGYAPRVSLHVPTYNEPPEIVQATLLSLDRLDYPNYEVLVIDNNTPDEATWRPIEALCRRLGPKFKCVHLARWPGYKSGALNFALTQTAADAELIGIVDADYEVARGFLRESAPYFADARLAFLQTPQDYRDYQGNRFLRACYHAYKYFFDVSMPARNERNAIIFCGTMGLIRKAALQAAGGWDEWCITEDAEMSLRLLRQGWQSLFVNRTYGRGLMPLSFDALKKQRFRWCFGGIQILRKHWEALMPWARQVDPANRLTRAQQYFYLMGGLQWYNELLTLFFTAFLLLGGLALLSGRGLGVRPLAGTVIAVPLVLLALGAWRFGWALRHALQLRWRQAAGAMGVFFSLGWTVTLASIQGLIQPRGVFLRTPKARSRSSLLRAVRVAQWESAVGAACALVGLAVVARRTGLAGLVVAPLLLWQASLYLAAPAYSLMSLRGEGGQARTTSRGEIQGRLLPEGRAARWSLALLLLIALGAGLLHWLPQPAAAPHYSSLLPTSLAPDALVGELRLPSATPVRTRTPTSTFTATPTASPTPSPTDTSRPSTRQPPRPATAVPVVAATTQAPGQASATPPGGATATPLPALTPTPTQPPLATQVPSPTATQGLRPTQAPTPQPLPTQAQQPTQPPQPSATPQPLPTQAQTAVPTGLPTEVPTHPAPSAVPTHPTSPAPTPPRPG